MSWETLEALQGPRWQPHDEAVLQQGLSASSAAGQREWTCPSGASSSSAGPWPAEVERRGPRTPPRPPAGMSDEAWEEL